MLKPAKEHGVKIIINMGAVNPHAAVMKVMEIAEEQGITGLKFAAVTGDSIDDSIEQYYDEEILEFKGKVADWKDQIVSANVYMGAEGIIEALRNGADVIITGRVADPTLTLAPLRYEYGWTSNDADKMGQCVLAGHGYNVTTFNVPVTYCGTNDEIKGQYQLAIWENHADPIICGREQLGYSKIYADITDICEEEDGTYAALSSWNFEFLKLHFKMDEKPDDLSEMQKVLFDEENEGIMHYKYIPHSEAGFNKADVQYVTITPKTFPAPEDAKPLPQPERVWGNASLEWWIPERKDMPTQYHIVQVLASLPILRVIGASKVHLWHYNDVYHQKAIE